MERIIVTGSCGFIGMHLCKSLCKDGYQVFGLDNMNDYYSVDLKRNRLKELKKYKNFLFANVDISNFGEINSIFENWNATKVVNLAAQAGVRYSLTNPQAYIQSNIVGFMNILEACRYNGIEGLIYASSSSVYGGNKKIPFSVDDSVDKPISIYAATKKSNELMAHSYSHLYGMHTTGLRFFTVYGPWGRPDMAMYIFTKNIIKGKEISVFNHGKMERDFTYIDDIISGIRSSIEKNYKCEIFNLGNNKSENLMDMIKIVEETLGLKAELNFMGMQPGDVRKTFADIDHSINRLGYSPNISIREGIPRFIKWFKSYSGN
ncbi:MAG: protein CapI [Candidatus Marinimicrobia bacterium]|nr:protein CapI [Candidatus Neomarinimicrobiota bacterium]